MLQFDMVKVFDFNSSSTNFNFNDKLKRHVQEMKMELQESRRNLSTKISNILGIPILKIIILIQKYSGILF